MQPVKRGLLHAFVSLATDSDVETDVTIFLRGITLTGSVISLKEYMATVADTLTKNIRQTTQVSASELGPMVDERFGSVMDNIDASEIDDAFIHLKNAQILINGAWLPFEDSSALRIRYDAIDGFALGTVNVPQSIENLPQ